MNWILQRTRRGLDESNSKENMKETNSGIEGGQMVRKWLSSLASAKSNAEDRVDASQWGEASSPSDSADVWQAPPRAAYPEVLMRAMERAGLGCEEEASSMCENDIENQLRNTTARCSEPVQSLIHSLMAAEAATLQAADDEHYEAEEHLYLGPPVSFQAVGPLSPAECSQENGHVVLSSPSNQKEVSSPSTMAPLSQVSQQSSTSVIKKSALSKKSSKKKKKGTPNRVRFARADMSSLDFSREDSDQVLDRVLRHLTGALVAAEAVRKCTTSRNQAQSLREALRADEILLRSEQKARAASFLACEIEILCGLTPTIYSPSHNPVHSQILTRHTEILSSVLRKEMKRQLNETLSIAANTGNLRFNFDDPAALLHRALETIHDHGGPGWAATFTQLPEITTMEEAHDLLNATSAHGFALAVASDPIVCRRVVDGRLNRLQGLAQLVRQVASPNDVLDHNLILPNHHHHAALPVHDIQPQPKRRKFIQEESDFSDEYEQIQGPSAPTTPAFAKKSASLTPTSIASLGALYDMEKFRSVLAQSHERVHQLARLAVAYINKDAQQGKGSKRKRKSTHQILKKASPTLFLFPELCDSNDDDDEDDDDYYPEASPSDDYLDDIFP